MTDLDPSLLAAARKKDLANILTRIKEGKAISKAERELLYEEAPDKADALNLPLPEWAKNKSQCAKLCGFSIKNWGYYAQRPGFPKARLDGAWPVREVRAFLDREGLAQGFDNPEDESRREEKLRLENTLLKMDIAEREGKLIPVKEAFQIWENCFIGSIVSRVKTMHYIPMEAREQILRDISEIPISEVLKEHFAKKRAGEEAVDPAAVPV